MNPSGSPPRVRGKLADDCFSCPFDGITPARAGKTARYPGYAAQNADHPRACGENDITQLLLHP